MNDKDVQFRFSKLLILRSQENISFRNTKITIKAKFAHELGVNSRDSHLAGTADKT